MTLQEFINKYNGKPIDFDGAYGNQCMDLYRQYVKEVWGLQQTPTVIGAYQVFDSLGLGYEKFTQGHIMPGDVMTWTEKYTTNGHIGVVVSSSPTTMQVFEQNNPKGSNCGIHTRNYGNIKGWFRPVSNQIAKTFMKITVVANNSNWTTLPEQLESLKQRFLTASNGKFEPVFDIKKTAFQNIPFEQIGGQQAKSVQINWYRANISPLATGQATLLMVNPEQWIADGSFGTMTWGDSGKPVRTEVKAQENYPDGVHYFIPWTFHEICHALQFLTEQPDRTHEFLLPTPSKEKEMMDYIDYRRLQAALVKIKL